MESKLHLIMVLAKTGPWKFVIVYVINWYILQLRISHNWQEIRLIVLIAAHQSTFQL